MNPTDAQFAHRLLIRLVTEPLLIRHCLIVSAVARELALRLSRLVGETDVRRVEIAALLHDIGKVIHLGELTALGRLHERAGERILLDLGVDADIARCCRTHGEWHDPTNTLMDLIVALADHIWKGTREAELEGLVIAMVAKELQKPDWEVLLELDPVFERIAADGPRRLAEARSVSNLTPE